jgi:hypothetical protein
MHAMHSSDAGVPFVATPAKFLAPGLPMAQALDVGRWTFHVLARTEWSLAGRAAGCGMAVEHTAHRLDAWLPAAIGIMPAAQSFYLRPLLDARVLRIVAGEAVAPDRMHMLAKED